MTTQGKIADAGGDIAALVYSNDDRPDLVLSDFARHLADSGHRMCGLIQLRDRASEESRSRVMVLDSWQVVDVVPAGGCRLDAQWLDQMGATDQDLDRARRRCRHRQPLRPLEAAGRGFSEAIAAASETETPLSSPSRNSNSSAGPGLQRDDRQATLQARQGPGLVAQSVEFRSCNASSRHPSLRAVQVAQTAAVLRALTAQRATGRRFRTRQFPATIWYGGGGG